MRQLDTILHCSSLIRPPSRYILFPYTTLFRSLPYVVPPLGLFLDRPAAVDLLAVLRAIAYGFDRGAQISAARSPYFALTDAEIAAGILNDQDGPWKEFRMALDAFRDASRHLTVAALID